MCRLLPYSCCYENSRGEMLRLDEAPIVVQSSGLFDYQWSLTTFDRAMRDGGKAVFARRGIQEKSLTVDVFADTQEEHNAALDRLHDVLEYDMCCLSPGKLWINDQYVRCFAVASAKTLDRDWTRYTAVRLSLKIIGPAWTAEQSVTLLRSETAANAQTDGGKKYLGRYDCKYADEGGEGHFRNTGCAPAPMRIKLFGPCVSPSVYVGGYEYSVNGEIDAGAYAVIDQEDKRVLLVSADGQKSDIFGRRKKSVDNFRPAPSGNVTIRRGEPFACEVTFLVQRSEPKWSV